MKPLFIKKNGTVSKVSGIIMNLIPSYTMAEYNALTHKPLLWVRTDEEYAQIPSTDVSYGSGSVKDALDGKVSKSGDTMSGNFTIDRKNGTSSTEGQSYLTLGNSTPVGTNQNSTGIINLYSESAYPAVLYANSLTQTRYIGFPNKSGTVLMDSDLTYAYQVKYAQSVGSQYRWTITRSVADPTFIFIHHSGGANFLVGVWMMNYWMPLTSYGSVMTVQSVDNGQIVIDVKITYHRLEVVGVGNFTVTSSAIPS